MAKTKRKEAYQEAHLGLTTAVLTALAAVAELQAGQRLHPSRQGAYARRALRILREVEHAALDVKVALQPVLAFSSYEQRQKAWRAHAQHALVVLSQEKAQREEAERNALVALEDTRADR